MTLMDTPPAERPVPRFPAELGRQPAPGTPLVFLSPHLDDVVLSCAALASSLAQSYRVIVVTVFTDATPPPHTRAGRSYLRQCGRTRADHLYQERRAEDIQALRLMGAEHVHLGAVDALFRRRRGERPEWQWVVKRIPELGHIYPTYRFDAALGRISRADRSLMGDLHLQITELVAELRPYILFAPLGVGRHVDHVIVRETAARIGVRLCYYADFPYSLRQSPDKRFLRRHRLLPWTWLEGLGEKRTLVEAYETQVRALFPGGVVPQVAECYYSGNDTADPEKQHRTHLRQPW